VDGQWRLLTNCVNGWLWLYLWYSYDQMLRHAPSRVMVCMHIILLVEYKYSTNSVSVLYVLMGGHPVLVLCSATATTYDRGTEISHDTLRVLFRVINSTVINSYCITGIGILCAAYDPHFAPAAELPSRACALCTVHTTTRT
jgi:hypothetical protein